MPQNNAESNKKVKLVSAQTGRRVTFRASPTVTENRNVNYNSLEPLHAPGQIQVYKNTSSRSFSIADLKLISRTTAEADANLKILWQLRAWTMPRFGNSSTLNSTQRTFRNSKEFGQTNEDLFFDNTERDALQGKELLGAPPDVLYLSAYSETFGKAGTVGDSKPGTEVWQRAQHLNRIPVVIQQLTIPYPNDVDYINTSKGVPMPIIMNLDLALVETHSPNAYEAFSLPDFRKGILKGF